MNPSQVVKGVQDGVSNGNFIIDEWEVAFNCSGKNNYSSLLQWLGFEMNVTYGNYPGCNYTKEHYWGTPDNPMACMNISCLPFCHPKTSTTTTTITTTSTFTITSTTMTTTTTSTSTTTSTTTSSSTTT